MSERNSQTGKRRPQFTIVSLLLAVAILGVAFGWVARKMDRARRQEVAATVFIEMGATLTYENGNVTTIHFSDYNELSNDDLQHLGAMPYLDRISLNLTQVTDRGLSHLAKARRLRKVDINKRHVSETGAVNLNKMPRLEEVRIWGAGGTNSETHEKLRSLLDGVEIR